MWRTLDFRHLYIMWHSSLLLVKFGISTKPHLRANQVTDSVAGSVTPITSVCVPFARFWEGVGHALCFLFRVRLRGNGGTEFFWLPCIVVFWAIQFVAFFGPICLIFFLLFCIWK